MLSTDISIVATQQPGIATFSNYAELREQLQGIHDYYMLTEYSEDPDEVKRAESDRAALRKAKRVLTSALKELEEGYTRPFAEVKEQITELIDLLKEPEKRIDLFIKGIEKAAKRNDIQAYAAERAAALGSHAARILESPAFFNEKWLNVSYKLKDWRADVDGIIARAIDDLETIEAAGGQNRKALLARYYETLSMEGANEFLEALQGDVADEVLAEMGDEDAVVGYKVLKIYATERQMLKVLGQLELAGVEFDELEDGMPRSMEELASPCFEDYVCFDIETTGTFGIARGDADAEITEIGAVKVIGGQVVERFDMLANPGRRIVPRIARLTHITDDLVASEPPVDEVIAAFAEFCRGFVLVGHNVKSCDIPHISHAAKRAGVAMENQYFDTYQYAKKFKESQGWENVKLEYLSGQFGLQHEDAHRAWCDAEANVGVFQRLKELGGV